MEYKIGKSEYGRLRLNDSSIVQATFCKDKIGHCSICGKSDVHTPNYFKAFPDYGNYFNSSRYLCNPCYDKLKILVGDDGHRYK